MAASQGQFSKQISIVEKHLTQTNRDESKYAIINEYKQFLLGQIEYEKEEEKTLMSLQCAHEKIGNSTILNSFLILQEKVQTFEKRLATLEDDIDNLTIKSIAEKESFKIQQAEKEREIKSFYISEEKRAIEELERVNKECAREEEEIRNRISSEIAPKNARLCEIKSNLQTQIINRNNDYTKAQNEGRELRKQLEELKSNAASIKKLSGGNNYGHNIMQFQSNISAPQDKEFLLPSILNNTSFKLKSDSVEESLEQKENAAPNKLNTRISDKERSRLADEYEQFEQNFTVSPPPTAGSISQKMKPNPCSIVANRGKRLQVTSPNDPKLVKINKTEPYTDDDLDETKFFDVMNNDSVENVSGNAPRKLPNVYMGKAKKRKPYRQSN